MSEFLRHLFIPHHSNNLRAKLLHPTGISLLIGSFTIFQLVLNQLSYHFPQILGYASKIPPEQIISLTNSERRAAGLPDVHFDAQLSSAAAQKAADMYARDYWAHVSPQGTQPWFFITSAGYNYRYAGENLARDFADPGSVIKAWVASPSHRENLLNPRYQDIGVAVVDGRLGGRETTLVVQFFGTRLSAAPSLASGISDQVVARAAPLESPAPAPAPVLKTNPFTLTKYLSLFLLGVFSTILVIDVYTVYKHRLVRWTSRSFAHLALMIFLLFAVAYLNLGQIK